MRLKVFICFILSLYWLDSFAQEDSAQVAISTEAILDSVPPAPTQRNPKRAALLSAIFPGTGQIYNKKYWKLPIVYGAVGTAGYFFFSNRSEYLRFKSYYVMDADTTDGMISPFFYEASLDQLRSAADQYRKWMEYSAIAFSIVYVLQIVDATVDAHLFYFDVSDDLSLRVEPSYRFNRLTGPTPGAGITLWF